MKRLRSLFNPKLVLFIVPLILLGRFLFLGKRIYWGTAILQFIPWQQFAWSSIISGAFPLWNPYNGLGVPFSANYQSAVFYPPNWILMALNSAGGISWMTWGYSLLLYLHLVLAGLGIARFLRIQNYSELAQTIAGLAYSLGGYFIGRTSFSSMIWAGAWMPWVFVGLHGLLETNFSQFRSVIKSVFRLSIILVMLLLCGHAQITWYTLLLGSTWVLFMSVRSYGWKEAGKRIGLLISAGILAGITAGIQLIPTAEFLLQSQRSTAVSFDAGMTYSYWPWRLITWFAPYFFGNPGLGTFRGYASFWEDATYLGILPLILALTTLGIILANKKTSNPKEKQILYFWWLVVIVGFILALGKNTPIFPFLYKYVPTFSLFNAPARFMIWVVFAGAILAGAGIDELQKFPPYGKRLVPYRLLAVISLAMSIGALTSWIFMKDLRAPFVAATGLAGMLIFVVALLIIQHSAPVTNRIQASWHWIVILFVSLDLVIAGVPLIPAADSSLYSEQQLLPAVDNARMQGERVFISPQDEYILKFRRFFRFDDLNPLEPLVNIRQVLLPNTNLFNQVSMVNNFDPLLPNRLAYWLDRQPAMSHALLSGWLRLMNVRIWEHLDVNSPDGISFEEVQPEGRVTWHPCAIFAENKLAAFEKITQEIENAAQSDPMKPVLETVGAQNPTDCTVESGFSVSIIKETPDQIALQVTSPADGWLVLHDLYYPGWQATVDGVSRAIYPADSLFRGIAIEKGQHLVEYVYKPASFRYGAISSLVGWGLIGLLALSSMKKRINSL